MSKLSDFSDEEILVEMQRRQNTKSCPKPLFNEEQLDKLEKIEGLHGIKNLFKKVESTLDEEGYYSKSSSELIALAAYEFVYGELTWKLWNVNY
jgi:hypothetical protein